MCVMVTKNDIVGLLNWYCGITKFWYIIEPPVWLLESHSIKILHLLSVTGDNEVKYE